MEEPNNQQTLPFNYEDIDRFKKRLMRTKTIISQSSIEDDRDPEKQLQKVLSTFDLISLGVGSCAGTGMYVVAGLVAKNVAGPAAIFSFIIAAIASILSGVCYAEFGVRVPKTSGSAYMYSYVAVGEFVAFLIGWNLILEYMIGSAAGASALSSVFDALANHTMSNYLEENVGTVIGKTYPDFLGCAICLVMTAILAIGVKKSVTFNNILNAINMLVLVFIFIAGLCFADGSNWSGAHFAPYGASGVFSGAATCFYAFIGFDIIATTGEEARSPTRSIPIAIVVSLVVCLLAYVIVTMVLTLMVPFDDIHGSSALIDMFVQRDFGGAKWVVAIGAFCALTVSLLGSLFPMPRVIYAMSRDGLLFSVLSSIHPKTGTPLVATIVTGVLSSLLSLTVGLQILVEMMSIGTLLAYTLVCVSVLILRYQPTPYDMPIPMAHRLDPIEESPDSMEDGGDEVFDPARAKRMFKDDAMLITPTEEQKGYGSLPFKNATLESKIAMVQRYAKMYWLRMGFPSDDVMPNERSAKTVIFFTGLLALAQIAVCITGIFGHYHLERGRIWAILLILFFFICVFACMVVILRQPQNKKTLKFMAPAVPILPALAMFFNFYLMLKLPGLTWARLGIWICLGLLLYFGFSMMNSAKEKKRKSESDQQQAPADTTQAQTDIGQTEYKSEMNGGTTIGHNTPIPPGAPNGNIQVSAEERRSKRMVRLNSKGEEAPPRPTPPRQGSVTSSKQTRNARLDRMAGVEDKRAPTQPLAGLDQWAEEQERRGSVDDPQYERQHDRPVDPYGIEPVRNERSSKPYSTERPRDPYSNERAGNPFNSAGGRRDDRSNEDRVDGQYNSSAHNQDSRNTRNSRPNRNPFDESKPYTPPKRPTKEELEAIARPRPRPSRAPNNANRSPNPFSFDHDSEDLK